MAAGKYYSLVDASWELIDPCPDVHELFCEFNKEFFQGKLTSVYVDWSSEMKTSAGLTKCAYLGELRDCSISLSEPLLSLRPRRDLVETLLHEMIHAYLFVVEGSRDREGHGPDFLYHMNRINRLTGAKISVYHSFHDEVDYLKPHWWKCGGRCQHRPPYFGVVKRSTNRPPGINDLWYNDHQRTCGGTFVKVKEPKPYPTKTVKRPKSPPRASSSTAMKTSKMVPPPKAPNAQKPTTATSAAPSSSSATSSKSLRKPSSSPGIFSSLLGSHSTAIGVGNFIAAAFPGKGHTLGSSSNGTKKTTSASASSTKPKPRNGRGGFL
ncbi:SprT-like domain-containing protein Spartan, partial [Orchesella cincta]